MLLAISPPIVLRFVVSPLLLYFLFVLKSLSIYVPFYIKICVFLFLSVKDDILKTV